MKIKLFNALLFVLMLLLVSAPKQYAERTDGKKVKSLNKTTGSPSYTRFNINKISTWIKNDGESDINQNGNSGFVYPKGTNQAAVFQSGFLYGGKINGEIRVGGSTYNQGQKPGAIVNGVAEDPNLDHVRIYRVRRDYKTGNLSPEAQDEGVTEAEVYEQYDADWNEWPAAYGAPYEDVDGDGSYNPEVDIPGKPGADQTIWFVNNDLDATAAQGLYGSLPMGVEMQATLFGYNRIGPLGSILFREYQIINKSSNDFTDFYVCMWSDPDVGDATDDFSGCDTTLSLGFTYNGNPNDATYGPNPPATGFDFFQGPVVAGEATDTAKALGRRIPGYKNLGMSAFFFFINSDPVYSDPNLGEYAEGTLEMYNLFQGKIGTTGEFFVDPNTGLPTTFTLSGDPVAGTGWLDGQLHPPGDRRIGMVAGPFTMAAGDTQEVVVGQIAAGASPGISSLQAVTLLKQYDEVAQATYDADFEVPAPPRLPVVSIGELDEQIVLSWGSDVAAVTATENHSFQGYEFQGYNVYQLPTQNAGLRNATKIATFDIVDGIKNIVVKEIDENTGVEVSVVSQTGSDSGLKRYLVIKRDAINNQKLVNGKKYYFAVTSYAYNPSELAVPQVLENDAVPLTIIPHSTDPGVRYDEEAEATLETTHTGTSDGSASVTVVDPSKVTGDSYEVRFRTVEDPVTHTNVTVWDLVNVTKNTTVISGQRNQSGDDDYLVTDGLLVKVMGPPLGIKQIAETDADETIVDPKVGILPPSLGPNGYILTNRAGAVDYEGFSRDYDRFNYWGTDNVIIDFGEESLAWDYINETVQVDPNTGDPIKVPFSVYREKFPSGERVRLFAGFWDTDGNGTWNFAPDRWEDPVYHAPSYEPIYCWQGYDASGNEISYDPANEADYIAGNDLATIANTTFGSSTGEFVYPYVTATLFAMYLDGATPPSAGNKVIFFTNKSNTPSDVFAFTAPAVTESAELAKEDVKKINVFPNPYYGVNSEELNKYQRFVTFNHLPAKAKIRIFNLAGQLVRTIDKNSNTQFAQWDLLNKSGLPVASGLYIVYIDMPDLGTTKTLKAAIIQEQQVLDRF